MTNDKKLGEAVAYCRANSGYRVTSGCGRGNLLLVHDLTGRISVTAGKMPELR